LEWTTGGNLSGVTELNGCVYFFDNDTQDSAKRVRDVVDSAGKKTEHFQQRPPSSKHYRDILAVSGIDIEVIL